VGTIAVRWALFPEGKPTEAVEIIPAVLDVIPEMLWQSTPLEATDRIVAGIQALDRYEITARDSSGSLIGFASVAEDVDDHVGPTLSVQWLFVAEGHRGVAGFRLRKAIYLVAEELGYRVLAYTHRLGEGRYELIYKRLRPRSNNG
jgi:hypothetical protein